MPASAAGLFNLLPARIFGVVTNYTLLAMPLFIFMGIMLESSRIAEDLLDVIGLAMGSIAGGMALAIILVGVLMGAALGIVGATVVTLGLIALDRCSAAATTRASPAGVICASGTLGQIIPPSLVLILLSDIMGEVGRHAVRRRADPRPDRSPASSSPTSSPSATSLPDARAGDPAPGAAAVVPARPGGSLREGRGAAARR